MSRPGFGRRHVPDDRDRRHLMRASPVFEKAAPGVRWRRWWNRGARLNQGNTGTCVAHMCVHLAENGPVTRPGTMDPYELYRQIVLLDEFSENDREAIAPIEDLQFGSSVRAGAKALQALGILGEYLWEFETIDPVIDWILGKGPVGIGVNWYTGMLDTDDKGMIRVTGRVEGGHAVLLDAVNLDDGVFRGLNSWGTDWGTRGGTFRLSFEDMDRLLREDGEALAAVELRPTPAKTFEEASWGGS